MVASTDIKFFVHTNNNAPQLQNAYGSMINVLDACLVNGINIGTVSSLTASGTTVTALFSSAHNLMQYQVIKITGASQPEFNGEHRILTVPNVQSVTFELAAAPSTTTATGTISASLPSLGWEKPFSSINLNGGGKAAYRSTNLLLPSRPFLRVVDELDPEYAATYAKYAKVGLIESMSGIDVFGGVQGPYDGAQPEKNWKSTGSGSDVINGWAKWYYARNNGYQVDASADTSAPLNGDRTYYVVGNSDFFYILPSPSMDIVYSYIYGFGRFDSYDPDIDVYNNYLSSTLEVTAASVNSTKPDYTSLSSNTNNALILQRPIEQSPVCINAKTMSISGLTAYGTGSIDYLESYSSTQRLCYAEVIILEGVKTPRGKMPILFWNMQMSFNFAVLTDKNHMLLKIPVACRSGANGSAIFHLGDR